MWAIIEKHCCIISMLKSLLWHYTIVLQNVTYHWREMGKVYKESPHVISCSCRWIYNYQIPSQLKTSSLWMAGHYRTRPSTHLISAVESSAIYSNPTGQSKSNVQAPSQRPWKQTSPAWSRSKAIWLSSAATVWETRSSCGGACVCTYVLGD